MCSLTNALKVIIIYILISESLLSFPFGLTSPLSFALMGCQSRGLRRHSIAQALTVRRYPRHLPTVNQMGNSFFFLQGVLSFVCLTFLSPTLLLCHVEGNEARGVSFLFLQAVKIPVKNTPSPPWHPDTPQSFLL